MVNRFQHGCTNSEQLWTERVNMGLKGRLEMWGSETDPRMIVPDIERGARSMITEGASQPLSMRSGERFRLL
jgi:hypothetical protein